MPLRKLPYVQLESLIRRHLSTEEDRATTALIRRLRIAKKRGYLTPSELEAVCYWKSPRAIHHIRSNSRSAIRAATRLALTIRSERGRLEALRQLKGVSVPTASALLTLVDPRRYGVIDIRVWQLLYVVGTVRQNEAGIGFNFKHWEQFLTVLRHFARKYGVTARDIERTLFLVHREYQTGTLYRSSREA
jgi:hypothetical protein